MSHAVILPGSAVIDPHLFASIHGASRYYRQHERLPWAPTSGGTDFASRFHMHTVLTIREKWLARTPRCTGTLSAGSKEQLWDVGAAASEDDTK